MTNYLLKIDYLSTTFIVNFIPRNNLISHFFSFLSLRGESLTIWLILVIFLILFEEKINRKFIFYFFIGITMTFFVISGIKIITRRPRPINNNKIIFVKKFVTNASKNKCPEDFSFPSGHAGLAFVASGILSFFDRKRKYFYYIVALLISLSRIYLFCHYFGDVLLGAIIGYLIAKLLLRHIKKK